MCRVTNRTYLGGGTLDGVELRTVTSVKNKVDAVFLCRVRSVSLIVSSVPLSGEYLKQSGDRIFQIFTTAPPDNSDELGKLFGLCDLDPALSKGRGLKIFADGSAKNNGRHDAAAGAGLYAGQHHSFNCAVRVTGNQTNN
jgi:hypothetical protein